MSILKGFLASVAGLIWASAIAAQVSFGGLTQDPNAPVEISADQLSVNQDDNSAVFSGNVVIGQGSLRLAAPKVVVTYGSGGGISQLSATGGVTLVTAAEEAEAESAQYSLDDDVIVMQGNVLLKQGANVLSAQSMRVNLATGDAALDGRVRTILQPAPKN